MNIFSKQLAATAALVIGAGMITADAHASFWVRVDNYTNPTKTTWTGTKDTVTICAVLKSTSPWATLYPGCQTLGQFPTFLPGPITTISGTNDFINPAMATVPWSDVASVKISTNGSDNFLIDQVELLDDLGTVKVRRGNDDMFGWCLSKDPKDTGSLCVSTAKPSFTFNF